MYRYAEWVLKSTEHTVVLACACLEWLFTRNSSLKNRIALSQLPAVMSSWTNDSILLHTVHPQPVLNTSLYAIVEKNRIPVDCNKLYLWQDKREATHLQWSTHLKRVVNSHMDVSFGVHFDVVVSLVVSVLGSSNVLNSTVSDFTVF